MAKRRPFHILRSRRFLAAFTLLFLGFSGVGVIGVRWPIVIVSDAAFETLYGEKRASWSRAALSLLSFRPVRLALVSETASPAAAADAVSAVVGRRGFACVLVPSRYRAGAEALAARFPKASILLVGGTVSESRPDNLIFCVPDRETDLYRAGKLSTALSAGRRIALRLGGEADSRLKDAFNKGCADAGYKGIPLILGSSGLDVTPSAGGIFEVDASFSVDVPPASIVFSWADPSFLPKETQVIVDDSIYGIAFNAYLSGARRKTAEIPSRIRVFARGIGSPGKFIEIQAAVLAVRH